MKLTIWTLTSDLHNQGTATEVLTAESRLHARLAEIMEADLQRLGSDTDNGPDYDASVSAVRAHLCDGEIERAWSVWYDDVKRDDDYYWTRAHEIEVPGALSPDAAGEDEPNDYTLAPEAASCWIGVENLSVQVCRKEGGVVVGIYAAGHEAEDAIDGCAALFSDAQEEAV